MCSRSNAIKFPALLLLEIGLSALQAVETAGRYCKPLRADRGMKKAMLPLEKTNKMIHEAGFLNKTEHQSSEW